MSDLHPTTAGHILTAHRPHPDRLIEARRVPVPRDDRPLFTAIDLFIGLLIGVAFFPAVRLLMHGLAMLAEVAR